MLVPLLLTLAVLNGAAEPERVAAARASKIAGLKAKFEHAGVAYPARQILVRVLKREGLLELWAGNAASAPLALVASWPVCWSSGVLGPKRREGDGQVPEGVYALDKLNPHSQYYMSVHVSYPNEADRAAGRRLGVDRLGGDIMVHGNCVTIGCIPIGDGPIEELYLAIFDSHLKPPIHILPARLDEAGLAHVLELDVGEDVRRLWKDELAPIDRAFERERRIPRVSIDAQGHYRLE